MQYETLATHKKAPSPNLSTTQRKGRKRNNGLSEKNHFDCFLVLTAFHFVVQTGLKCSVFLLSLLDTEVTGMHHHFLQAEHFCWWKCLSDACAGEKGWVTPVKALVARAYFRVCSHLGFHLSVGDNYIVVLGGELSVGSFLLQQFSPLHLSKALHSAVWLPIAVLTCRCLAYSDLCCAVVLGSIPAGTLKMGLQTTSNLLFHVITVFFNIKIKHCCNLEAVDLFCMSCEIVWK